MSDSKVYLTPGELASRFKNTITVKTLANWRSQDTGPAYVKLGGRILYEIGDVSTWEASRRQEPGKTPAPKPKR